MDITLSVGFLSGITGKENSKISSRDKMYNSGGGYNQNGVRAMITALIPDTSQTFFDHLTSAPLEATKDEGAKKGFTAMFPLRAGDKSSSITIPGLLKGKQRSGNDMSYDQPSFKPTPIEILVSLVYQHEQLCFGKTTILATGDELRTKQMDLPIDTARDSITRAQKKSNGGKKATLMKVDRHGDIAATGFKSGRSCRKYKIEKDALLRVFIKAISPNTRLYAKQRRLRDRIPMESPSALRRSRSQSRDAPSSSRQQMSSRRSMSGYPENDYPRAAPAPIQRTSRSSSRSRSHGGIPLTTEPQDHPGYRMKAPGSQRNIPPLTQRKHASSYGGGGAYHESVGSYRSSENQRAHSVPRLRSNISPEKFNPSQSSRNRIQYQTSDSQRVYGGSSQYGGQKYAGDNSTMSSYRHGNSYRVQSNPPSQSVSGHSRRSRSHSHAHSRPRLHHSDTCY